MIDWLKGRPINPENEDEVIATINWLIEFQKKTKLGVMNKNDVIMETTFIKKGLEVLRAMKTARYQERYYSIDNHIH